MQMKPVFSSHVAGIAYDVSTSELHVKYRDGKHAVYSSVPADVGKTVMSAPSIGNAMHQHVRGKYEHRYLS